jgi:hypothetical protein
MNKTQISEERANTCAELRTILKQWDTQTANPYADIKQIDFLRMKINALCDKLDELDIQERTAK